MSKFVECKALTGRIEKYFTMHNQIGQGGSGAVFIATPTQAGIEEIGQDLPDTVAIKVIRKLFTHAQKEALKKEIMFLKLADLPHACKYYGCFENARGPEVYLVMDVVSGKNLYQILNQMYRSRTKLSHDQQKEILKQLANGIKELHDIKIIHRDLKLENVMVDLSADPIKLVIIDYGISCYIPDEKCDNMTGTHGYRDTRMIRDNMNSMLLGDWWSFGIIALEVFNNRPLVTGSGRIKTDVRNIPDEYRSLILQLIDEKREQDKRPSPEEIIMLFTDT